MSNVGMGNLSGAINGILSKYSASVEKEVKTITKDMASKTARKLEDASPSGPQGYKYDWKYKKQRGVYVVYNENHYRLTHLLEYGHISKNQYGGGYAGGGKVGARPHIAAVNDWVVEEFPRVLEEALEKAASE